MQATPAAIDLVRRQPGDVLAVEHDAAGARRRQAEDRADQRGLAGAVRAEHAGDAAGLDRKRNALQHIGLVVGGVDVPGSRAGRSSGLPQIGLRTADRAATSRKCPSQIFAAVVEHHAAVGDALDQAHLVFDDDDGRPGRRSRTEQMSSISSSRFVMRHAGRWFVEQDEARLADQRPADLDPAAIDHRQAGRRSRISASASGGAEHLQQLARLCAVALELGGERAGAETG